MVSVVVNLDFVLSVGETFSGNFFQKGCIHPILSSSLNGTESLRQLRQIENSVF